MANSMWYPILKSLYDRGLIDSVRLDNSVTKGLITEDEKTSIINPPEEVVV